MRLQYAGSLNSHNNIVLKTESTHKTSDYSFQVVEDMTVSALDFLRLGQDFRAEMYYQRARAYMHAVERKEIQHGRNLFRALVYALALEETRWSKH